MDRSNGSTSYATSELAAVGFGAEPCRSASRQNPCQPPLQDTVNRARRPEPRSRSTTRSKTATSSTSWTTKTPAPPNRSSRSTESAKQASRDPEVEAFCGPASSREPTFTCHRSRACWAPLRSRAPTARGYAAKRCQPPPEVIEKQLNCVLRSNDASQVAPPDRDGRRAAQTRSPKLQSCQRLAKVAGTNWPRSPRDAADDVELEDFD